MAGEGKKRGVEEGVPERGRVRGSGLLGLPSPLGVGGLSICALEFNNIRCVLLLLLLLLLLLHAAHKLKFYCCRVVASGHKQSN